MPARIPLNWWPGLPGLWHGRWTDLAVAAGFAALLNATLAVHFLWTGLWADLLAWPLTLGTTVIWARSLSQAVQPRTAEVPVSDDPTATGLFLRAQGEYLKGHWYEAETLLQEVLAGSPQDSDAHLLLAAVLRRSGRSEMAMSLLRHLQQLSNKWDFEVQREIQLLEHAVEGSSANATAAEASCSDESGTGEEHRRSAA